MLNRTRVWIICFNIDKSTSTQFGKPSTLKEDLCVVFEFFLAHWLIHRVNSIMRNSLQWYQSSQYNHPVRHLRAWAVTLD